MSSEGLQIIDRIIFLFLSIDTIGLSNKIGYFVTRLIIFSKVCVFSLSFKFNPIGGIFFTLLFAIYITRFQIIPEEAVMEKLFGDDFQKYKSKTRRKRMKDNPAWNQLKAVNVEEKNMVEKKNDLAYISDDYAIDFFF